MHYYVVGVNGSGKSTLLKAIQDTLGVRVIHGTKELMQQMGIPNDYDALRKINQDDVLAEWAKTANNLTNKYKTEDFLLDTHILNLTNGKVIRRDGSWIAKYDALVLVKAQPVTLLSRIVADSGKDRALFTLGMDEAEKIKTLIEYQDETEKLFSELSKNYELPSLVIENDRELDYTVEAFSRYHQSISL